MSKHQPRKKKLDLLQSVIPAPVPLPLPKPSKIKPHACLLANTFRLEEVKDRARFRVKRQYYRKLDIPSTSFFDKPRLDRRLLKMYPKMKFLRSFEAESFIDERYTKFYQRMRRLSDAKIVLSFRRLPCTTFEDNLKLLTRLNIRSLKVVMNFISGLNAHHEAYMLTRLMKSLRHMSNLKVFSCKLKNPADGRSTVNPLLIRPKNLSDKRISCKFKRLQKIEELKLVFTELPVKGLYNFAEGFENLPNLKIVKLKPMDSTHGRKLIERLHKLQTLTSVTLYHYVEPNDILSLAINVPSLNSITIKNDWIFTRQDMPLLTTICEKGSGITRLRFNLPMDVDSDEDVEFVCEFLSAFSQVRALSLYIQTSEESELLIPIGKQINKLSLLQQLELGVSTRQHEIPISFLASIDGLTSLKKISLTLKIRYSLGWDRRSRDICNALKPLLLQNKELKSISINWDRFTPQCAEALKLIINEMKSLDTFNLRYSTSHLEKVLTVFDNLFGQTATIIREVEIMTDSYLLNQRAQKVRKFIRSNDNIKNFRSETDIPYGELFFKHYLE